MYGVGHVDGIVAVFPAFGSLEKVAGKGSTFGKRALRVALAQWINWRFIFLPYLVQEFLEVSTSLHIRFLSRSPCITS
jgi:hypothetical protein